MPGFVRKMRVSRYAVDFYAQRFKCIVVVSQIAEFGWADKGEISGVEEHD